MLLNLYVVATIFNFQTTQICQLFKRPLNDYLYNLGSIKFIFSENNCYLFIFHLDQIWFHSIKGYEEERFSKIYNFQPIRSHGTHPGCKARSPDITLEEDHPRSITSIFWSNLAQWLLRRRSKCGKLTDVK